EGRTQPRITGRERRCSHGKKRKGSGIYPAAIQRPLGSPVFCWTRSGHGEDYPQKRIRPHTEGSTEEIDGSHGSGGQRNLYRPGKNHVWPMAFHLVRGILRGCEATNTGTLSEYRGI